MADVAVPDRHDTSSTGAAGGVASMRLGRAERGLAFALVVLFLVAIAVMYRLRDDQYWDRLLFLFGALEALVFAGAGALFGTTVQRGNLEVARKDAQVARQDADEARQDAAQAQASTAEARQEAARHREEARVLAERGTQLADTMRVLAASRRRPARTDRPGAGPEDLEPATPPSEVASLVELANLWFPPSSG
jgi:multidrug efflux pump subunit AcrA (membrane-fusion protein)